LYKVDPGNNFHGTVHTLGENKQMLEEVVDILAGYV